MIGIILGLVPSRSLATLGCPVSWACLFWALSNGFHDHRTPQASDNVLHIAVSPNHRAKCVAGHPIGEGPREVRPQDARRAR
jgi:hypothetical protein